MRLGRPAAKANGECEDESELTPDNRRQGPPNEIRCCKQGQSSRSLHASFGAQLAVCEQMVCLAPCIAAEVLPSIASHKRVPDPIFL